MMKMTPIMIMKMMMNADDSDNKGRQSGILAGGLELSEEVEPLAHFSANSKHKYSSKYTYPKYNYSKYTYNFK